MPFIISKNGGIAMKKRKTIWLYLDGKKHCDVVEWALAANVMVDEAKRRLLKMYPLHKATFKVTT